VERKSFLAIDSVHNFRAHVFVIKTESVSSFMTNYATKLRVSFLHCEAFEIECWFILSNLKNLCSDVGPVTGHVGRGIKASNAHLSSALCLTEKNICLFSPRVHVSDDAVA